jgi:hypothetical protein
MDLEQLLIWNFYFLLIMRSYFYNLFGINCIYNQYIKLSIFRNLVCFIFNKYTNNNYSVKFIYN